MLNLYHYFGKLVNQKYLFTLKSPEALYCEKHSKLGSNLKIIKIIMLACVAVYQVYGGAFYFLFAESFYCKYILNYVKCFYVSVEMVSFFSITLVIILN